MKLQNISFKIFKPYFNKSALWSLSNTTQLLFGFFNSGENTTQISSKLAIAKLSKSIENLVMNHDNGIDKFFWHYFYYSKYTFICSLDFTILGAKLLSNFI